MKYLIFAFAFLFSINSFADYKVYASQNQKINIPEKSGPWEAPSGKPAIHPNGVTITCLGMPNGENFELNGKTYRVVYDKTDAKTYAESACASNITNLSSTFQGNSDFNGDVSHWDTSNFDDMRSLFFQASSFNQDISNWDTSNVDDMGLLFHSAKVFNQDIGDWDLSNVKDMAYMFNEAEDFNQPIGNWDTSSVITMNYLFNKARSFNQDISGLGYQKCPEYDRNV